MQLGVTARNAALEGALLLYDHVELTLDVPHGVKRGLLNFELRIIRNDIDSYWDSTFFTIVCAVVYAFSVVLFMALAGPSTAVVWLPILFSSAVNALHKLFSI